MSERTGQPSKPSAIWICGPTAVGKTEVAVEVAARLDGEVISVDSMQVYVGMDIGTGKPGLMERKGIPHHLLDVVRLPEAFDAARFIVLAQEAEAGIRNRGKIPVFCGGTGLYFKAYDEGLGESPPADPELRAKLEEIPLEELGREIERKDPALWERMDRQNRRRLVRAVEVLRITGRPLSELQAEWKSRGGGSGDGPAGGSVLKIGLRRSREELRERIERRVAAMFQGGLVEETRRLCGQGLRECATARQALGYRQVLGLLDGNLQLGEAKAETVTRTQQYAKRQGTWFRGQCDLRWLDWNRGQEVPEVVDEVVRLWKSGCN